MVRMVMFEEAGVGDIYVNPDHVRCVSARDEERTLIEYANGDQITVMGDAQEIALTLESDSE